MTGENFGQHEIGDIGAGDEQDESNGTKENEQRSAHIANHLLAQGNHRGAPALVVFGILLFEPRGDGAEIRLSLDNVHTRLEPGNNRVIVIAAHGAVLIGPGERDPDLGKTGKAKRFGHDSGDHGGL